METVNPVVKWTALLVSIKKIKIQVDLRRASTAWQERNMYPTVQCAQAASVECIKSKIRLRLLRASTANLDLRLLRNPLCASNVVLASTKIKIPKLR